MVGKIFLSALLLVMLLQASASSIDTSSYSLLVSQMTQKEAELDLARANKDIETIISITKELDALRDQLSTPQMRFLRKYSDLRLSLDESEYLIGQMRTNLESRAVEQAEAEIEPLLQKISDSEAAYERQDYESADSLLEEVYDKVLLLPASISSVCVTGVENLKDLIERTSQVTPSMLSMLDNAREKFKIARSLYVDASEEIPSLKPDENSPALAEAHKTADEAFRLIARAKDLKSSLLEPVKLALILGPLVLIIGLLIYFRSQFGRSAIKSFLSSDTAVHGKTNELERTIIVSNIEKSPISVMVFDSPPKALSPSEFSPKPVSISDNNLTWEFDLDVGGRVFITYSLKIPPLDAGWRLKVRGATISYEIDGKQRKFIGETAEIRIV